MPPPEAHTWLTEPGRTRGVWWLRGRGHSSSWVVASCCIATAAGGVGRCWGWSRMGMLPAASGAEPAARWYPTPMGGHHATVGTRGLTQAGVPQASSTSLPCQKTLMPLGVPVPARAGPAGICSPPATPCVIDFPVQDQAGYSLGLISRNKSPPILWVGLWYWGQLISRLASSGEGLEATWQLLI